MHDQGCFACSGGLALTRAPCPLSQALAHFGEEIGIAFSGAEDVALIEYAKLTGRPFRVFR